MLYYSVCVCVCVCVCVYLGHTTTQRVCARVTECKCAIHLCFPLNFKFCFSAAYPENMSCLFCKKQSISHANRRSISWPRVATGFVTRLHVYSLLTCSSGFKRCRQSIFCFLLHKSYLYSESNVPYSLSLSLSPRTVTPRTLYRSMITRCQGDARACQWSHSVAGRQTPSYLRLQQW